MGLTIKLNKTIELTSADVEAIVKEYLLRETKDQYKVSFKVNKESHGYGPSEHDVLVFSGCTANMLTEQFERM